MNHARLAKLTLAVLFLPLMLIAGANIIVLSAARDLIHDDPATIDRGRLGLVLGCPPTLIDGSPNIYFEQRMDAATRLIKSGQIDILLLSGATDGGAYNEPAAMRQALLKRGLKSTQMELDDQGNRTFDSLYNVHRWYAGQAIVIITQRAHARRALFLAKHLGIDAVGFNAQSIDFTDTIKLTLRESLARVRAVVDIYLLGMASAENEPT